MLDPMARALFSDALRPPAGHAVDLAVGTTFTLSLRMLFLPPLAMAAHDRETELPSDDDEPKPDTLALLESIRRYADRTTLYCHAGFIGPVSDYPRLLTFAEDSLVQVIPRRRGSLFHPKLWALRFKCGDEFRHRLIVSSRNLSHDRSWDTILVLDEAADGVIDGGPAADFIRTLPGLAVGPVAAGRAEKADELARTLAEASFQPPAPFTDGALWPLGIDTATGWPMPAEPDRAIVISPFLDATAIGRIGARKRPLFVSRAETYDRLGSRVFEHADVRVLSPHAEAGDADDPAQRPSEVSSGLHAKVLVWDEGPTGHLVTGSPNATSAAYSGNVEFAVHLSGPRRSCGVEALLPSEPQTRDRIAFGHLLEPHTIVDPDPRPDPAFEAEQLITRFHEEILRAGPQLAVDQEGDGRFTMRLSFVRALPVSPGTTRVRPISRSRIERTAVDEGHWAGVPLLRLTPYLEIVTSVPIPDRDEPLEIACVLKADLLGAPEDRAAEVLRSYLGSEEAIVRYLRFLLDEVDAGIAWDEWEPVGPGEAARGAAPTFEDLAILEPLLRAAADGSEALDRVHALLRDLRVDRDDHGALPVEFLDMWEAVWSAARGSRS